MLKGKITQCTACADKLNRARKAKNKLTSPPKRVIYDNPDGTRTCRYCSEAKPLNEFVLRDRARGTYKNECLKCKKVYSSKRYFADPQKHRDVLRQSIYGLAPGEYAQMSEAQGGVCFICGLPERSAHKSGTIRSLFVDHDHATGAVRALLCMNCNAGIGQFRDNADLLLKAAMYIENHQAESP